MNQLTEFDGESGPRGLRAWLDQDKVKTGIGAALGGWMDANSFIAQILISMQDDKLAACTDQSKFEAAHLCASLMMLPSMGQVALIPRTINRNKPNEITVCTVMPQWQGFQALMLRNDDVVDVQVDLVHNSDSYHYDATRKRLEHDYDPFDERREINTFDDIRGGYLTVIWKDPTRPPKVHIVKKSTMMKARDCSQDYKWNSSKGTAIWDIWFEEQALKSVYRNAYARRAVPIDPLVSKRIDDLVKAEDRALENDPTLPANRKPITLESQTVPKEETRSRTELVTDSMKSEPEPKPKPDKVSKPNKPTRGEDPEPTQPELYPESESGDAEQALQKKPLYRMMKNAIEAKDSEAIDGFLKAAQASLDAGNITETEHQTWTDQAQISREQFLAQ